MLWYWDTGASNVDLDGREACQLAGIARDPAIDRVVEDISRKQDWAYTLWKQILTAVRERYPFKEDVCDASSK